MNDKIKKNLKDLKQNLPFFISDDKLISLALDISRNSDKKITKQINNFKEKNKLKITSIKKKKIRDYIIGISDQWIFDDITPIDRNFLTNEEILESIIILRKGIERSKTKVVGTIKARLERKSKKNENHIKYNSIFSRIEKDKNQLIIFYIRPEEKEDKLLDIIKANLENNYESLSNYHNIAFIFENYNKKKISWNFISKIAIYSEHFCSEKNFKVYNRQKNNKIEQLLDFIRKNENIKLTESLTKAVKDFYETISYGFQFNDLFISKYGDIKILILQKIKLDENPYPCPDCMKTILRGNSYPKLLLKSFECQNPECPSRSKIGRGKRFDLLSVKRNLMLETNHADDLVDFDFSNKFRRDIFDDENFLQMIIKFYSWHSNKVKILLNFNKSIEKDFCNRSINVEKLDRQVSSKKNTKFENLFDEIVKNIQLISKKPRRQKKSSIYSVYNGNSTNILSKIPEKITGVITSPPYYNARDYSQWPTLICYLIDMASNALAVYNKIENNSYYFYNIGDIVGQDNVFVSSQMSKKRLMLAFYSAMIFEKTGYKFLDSIIWDKGEVQSKRNSKENLFPGYIKPINCYEHILIFSKKIDKINLRLHYLFLDSVKKINSKGENILGHTAPYPEELVEIIFNYFDHKGYLLDPYLGSGTTIVSSKKYGYKSVGVELNNEYYELAIKRIEEQ